MTCLRIEVRGQGERRGGGGNMLKHLRGPELVWRTPKISLFFGGCIAMSLLLHCQTAMARGGREGAEGRLLGLKGGRKRGYRVSNGCKAVSGGYKSVEGPVGVDRLMLTQKRGMGGSTPSALQVQAS